MPRLFRSHGAAAEVYLGHAQFASTLFIYEEILVGEYWSSDG